MASLSGGIEAITAWESPRFTDFKYGSADVLVLDRVVSPYYQELVQRLPVAEYRARVTPRNAIAKIETGIRKMGLGGTGLAEDVTRLVQSFLAEFDRTVVSLRMEIVDTQTCPKFHSDNVFVRLVTTYVGPCTEYRYSGESAVHVAGIGSLVFLKGYMHPTHRDLVHHRSPPVPVGTKRLCLVLDY